MAFSHLFQVEYTSEPNEELLDTFYDLYFNVKSHNLGLNTFAYARNLFREMSVHPGWEFLMLRLKSEADDYGPIAGVMFCYKNAKTYVPSLVGMDYGLNSEYQVYRQLLYQTIRRAGMLGLQNIDFGFSATFEKRKLGAEIDEVFAFVQADDNFSMEMLGTLQNDGEN